MFELYFVLYRIPKMMTRLARERGRSAVAWSLLGIAAWIAAELSVAFGFGIAHALGSVFLGWGRETTLGWQVATYVAALAAAIGGFTLVRYALLRKSASPAGSAA